MGKHEITPKNRLNIVLASWKFLKKHIFAAISALVVFVSGVLMILSFFKPFYPLSDIDFDVLQLSYNQLKDQDFNNYLLHPTDFSIEECVESGNYLYTQLSLTNRNEFGISISKVTFEATNIQKIERPYLDIVFEATENYSEQQSITTPNEAFVRIKNTGTKKADDVYVYIDMNEINAFIKQKQDYISNPIFIDSIEIGQEIVLPIFDKSDFLSFPDEEIWCKGVYAECANSNIGYMESHPLFVIGPHGFGRKIMAGKGESAYAIIIDANQSMEKVSYNTLDIVEGNERFWFPICIAASDACTFDFTIKLEIDGKKEVLAPTKKVTFEYPKGAHTSVAILDVSDPYFNDPGDPSYYDLAPYPFDSENRIDYRQHGSISDRENFFQMPTES